MSRTSYYYPRTVRLKTDELDCNKLITVHLEHPLYGVRRLSVHLGWSQNKTRRIRKLAGINIVRPNRKRRINNKLQPEILAPINALKAYAVFKDKTRPQDGMSYKAMTTSGGWVQDFTYLWFERKWHYLAVVLDLKTRQVVGWRLGLNHSSELTYSAILDALSKHSPPAILHSDQGSEYLSHKHQLICQRMEITLSCSSKSSPWQNGFMERFFGSLKDELPPLNQLNSLAELQQLL